MCSGGVELVSTKTIEPYGLAPQFERLVAGLVCSRPKVYGSVGREIQPQRLGDPAAALAILGAQAHAKDAGRGPAHPVIVVQRLRAMHVEGKLKIEDINAVIDMFDEVVDVKTDEESVLAELVPAMRKVMHHEATLAAIEDSGKNKDLNRAEDMIQRARALGKRDTSAGSTLSLDTLNEIGNSTHSDRLGTGILELDIALNGGLPRGCTGVIIAATKVGKSAYLTNQIARGMDRGLFCLEATLELPELEQHARLISNLTGVPIDGLTDKSRKQEAHELLEVMLPMLGPFAVKKFPTSTTTRDVGQWVEEEQQRKGRKVDLLVIDHITHMGSARRDTKAQHEVHSSASKELWDYCAEQEIWGWTACPPKGLDKKDRNKRLDTDDAAGSIDIVRNLDLILTAWMASEIEIEMCVAGFRYGPGHFCVGPFPHDFTRGRFAPKP